MKTCSWKTWLAVLIFIVLNILLFYFGLKNTGFVDIKLMGILGFDATIVVSVYIVQNLIDHRRKSEYMVRLLDVVANDLESQELFSHKVQEVARIKQTYIANRLLHMKNVSPIKVKEDMQYVYDKFEETRTYYDEHVDASSDDKYYERQRNCILGKITKVQLNLFDFNVKDC